MPITHPTNALYCIKSLTVTPVSEGYYLSMNYGKAQACVLCISRNRLISAGELRLSAKDLEDLYNGGRVDFEDFTLQGISGRQLSALSQYRERELIKPPAFVQAWAMAMIQDEYQLFVPEDPASQMCLVPVTYQVFFGEDGMTVQVTPGEGYKDGDLQYSIEGRLPIPIPKSAIGTPFQLRAGQDSIRVCPNPSVEESYILKK